MTPEDVYVHGHAVQLPKWQGWARAAKEKLHDMIDGAHMPVSAVEGTAWAS